MDKQKYIFLDRDGTIIKDKSFMRKTEDIEFLPKAIGGLKILQQLGFRFLVLTNQSGIARNYYSIKEAINLNQELSARLAKSEVMIDKFYICPHHPDFTGDCQCRKPKVGMVKEAMKEFEIDLVGSFFIGDRDCDVELGRNCHAKSFLIKNNQYKNSSKPDFLVSDLEEAARIISELDGK